MTTLDCPADRSADDERLARDELRTAAMVWRRELIRFTAHPHAHPVGPHPAVLFLFVLGYGMCGAGRLDGRVRLHASSSSPASSR